MIFEKYKKPQSFGIDGRRFIDSKFQSCFVINPERDPNLSMQRTRRGQSIDAAIFANVVLRHGKMQIVNSELVRTDTNSNKKEFVRVRIGSLLIPILLLCFIIVYLQLKTAGGV